MPRKKRYIGNTSKRNCSNLSVFKGSNRQLVPQSVVWRNQWIKYQPTYKMSDSHHFSRLWSFPGYRHLLWNRRNPTTLYLFLQQSYKQFKSGFYPQYTWDRKVWAFLVNCICLTLRFHNNRIRLKVTIGAKHNSILPLSLITSLQFRTKTVKPPNWILPQQLSSPQLPVIPFSRAQQLNEPPTVIHSKTESIPFKPSCFSAPAHKHFPLVLNLL